MNDSWECFLDNLPSAKDYKFYKVEGIIVIIIKLRQSS